MSQPITIEDIYKLFEKTNEKFEQSRQEYDRRAAEAKDEADRRAAEYDRRAAEAKAEADRRLAQLEKTVANTSRAVDSLTTRWGRFVEELVEPAVIRLFRAMVQWQE